MTNLLTAIFSSPLFFFLILIIVLFNIKIYKKGSKTSVIIFLTFILIVFLFSGKLFEFVNSTYFLMSVVFISGIFILKNALNDKYDKLNITFFSILSLLLILSLNEYLTISITFEIIWGLIYIGRKVINYYLEKQKEKESFEYILANRKYDGPVIDEAKEEKPKNAFKKINNYLDKFVDKVVSKEKNEVVSENEIIPLFDETNPNNLYLEKELKDNAPTSYTEIEKVREDFNEVPEVRPVEIKKEEEIIEEVNKTYGLPQIEDIGRTYELPEESTKENIDISDDLNINDLYEIRNYLKNTKKNKA